MAIHDLTEDRPTRLALMRARIRAAHIPPAGPRNLRLATWNIRRFGEGARMDASIAMIAAILREVDLVAIVELCDDTSDLERTLHVLGPHFGAVFSDYLRDAAGNRERIGFVFDQRRIRFTGLASNAEGVRKLARGRYVEDVPRWRPLSGLLPAWSIPLPPGRGARALGGTAAARRSELAALARDELPN